MTEEPVNKGAEAFFRAFGRCKGEASLSSAFIIFKKRKSRRVVRDAVNQPSGVWRKAPGAL